MTEREITALVDLCDDGGVRAAALGWSRRPRHRCRVDGPWGRRKRWHHWCVTSAREIVALTIADLDWAGLAVAMVVDRATGRAVRDITVRPLGWGVALPEVADRGRVDLAYGRTRVAIADTGTRVAIVAATRRLGLDVAITRPADRDSLGVAVAWPGDRRRFAYTSKQAGLPARGTITVDGEPRAISDGAVACLDWGRGVWPRRTAWNWASAADARMSFNLGARWTHGTTENAVVVDGVLTKLGAEVAFAWDPRDPRRPWRLRGDQVDLTLTPEILEGAGAPGLGRLCIAFGSFAGVVGGVAVRDLFGWAEELRVLW
jgi:hypothetical protein